MTDFNVILKDLISLHLFCFGFHVEIFLSPLQCLCYDAAVQEFCMKSLKKPQRNNKVKEPILERPLCIRGFYFFPKTFSASANILMGKY